MPNAPRSAVQPGAAKVQPFEEALKKLEAIVDEMESGDLPLDSLLARFEEGTRLLKNCQSKLDEAELKISRLEKSGGELAAKPISVADED